MLSFKGYERAEGWSKGQPEVLVAKPTREFLGMPVVEYDSLEQLLVDDVGIQPGSKNHIKLYGQKEHLLYYKQPKRWGYFHPLQPNTVNVNAVCAEQHRINRFGTISILAHEERHLEDYRNSSRLNKLAIKVPLPLLFGTAVTAVAEASTDLPTLLTDTQILSIAIPTFLTFVGARIKHAIETPELERRAELQEEHPNLSDHQQDILFPHSQRTQDLFLTGQLAPEKIKALGIDLAELDLKRGLFAL